MRQKRGRLAQVWVETVVYTLIGLTIIGAIIAVTTPKIKQLTDKAIIEQTISAMNDLDNVIREVSDYASGTSLNPSFKIKKGELVIDSGKDRIFFVLKDTNLKYSQVGSNVTQGNLVVFTEQNVQKYNVYLILNYNFNLTFNGLDETKIFTQAPVAYNFHVTHQGWEKIDIKNL